MRSPSPHRIFQFHPPASAIRAAGHPLASPCACHPRPRPNPQLQQELGLRKVLCTLQRLEEGQQQLTQLVQKLLLSKSGVAFDVEDLREQCTEPVNTEILFKVD